MKPIRFAFLFATSRVLVFTVRSRIRFIRRLQDLYILDDLLGFLAGTDDWLHGFLLESHVHDIVDHGAVRVVAGRNHTLSIGYDGARWVISHGSYFILLSLGFFQNDSLSAGDAVRLVVVLRVLQHSVLAQWWLITFQDACLMDLTGRYFEATEIPGKFTESRCESRVMAAVELALV